MLPLMTSTHDFTMVSTHRELLLDGVAVKAAVRPASLSKANEIFTDKAFMPEGAAFRGFVAFSVFFFARVVPNVYLSEHLTCRLNVMRQGDLCKRFAVFFFFCRSSVRSSCERPRGRALRNGTS